MRQETDYKTQKNRCPNCGHRSTMHSGGCTAIMGNGHDPSRDHPCKCNLTHRSFLKGS